MINNRVTQMIKKSNKNRKYSEGLLDTETIINNLKICPGQSILDAGCGSGYMSKRFSELVGNTGTVYALDPDKEAIINLQKEVDNTSIKPLVGDITKTTGLENSSIDLVFLLAVFHIFSTSQISGFEKEIRRILKPRAMLAIINIDKKETPIGPPQEMRYSPEELRQRISLVPVKNIRVGEYFYMQLFENDQLFMIDPGI